MFLDLFYGLRDEGVPVAIQEWQMFMTVLEKGLHDSTLLSFYNLAKATLIKSETYFDAFDRVFAKVFHGVEGELSVSDELMDWLNDPKNFEELTEEQRQMLEHLDADELMRKFLETLAEQDERHDGGGKWVGTGGRSPFGHGGEHPTGIRVGGQSRSRSAMKVAEDRPLQGLPHRLDPRHCATSRSRSSGCATSPARGPTTNWTSTRASTRPAARPARSSSCTAPSAGTTCGCCSSWTSAGRWIRTTSR